MSVPQLKKEVLIYSAEREHRKMAFISGVGAFVAGASLIVTRVAASSTEDKKTILAMNILSAIEAVGLTVLAAVTIQSARRYKTERDTRLRGTSATTQAR